MSKSTRTATLLLVAAFLLGALAGGAAFSLAAGGRGIGPGRTRRDTSPGCRRTST
jgi:hypothetical protein